VTFAATSFRFRPLLLLAALAVAGCKQPAPAPVQAPAQTQTVASPEEGGAVSRAPVLPQAPAAKPERPPARPKAPDWSPLELASGQAWISCGLDYSQGDGEAVASLSRESLSAQAGACVEGDVLRLRYQGKIASDFTALVERVTRVADALGIGNRILDLDSTGGQVEDAIRAGDWIGNNHWTLWVREDSVCHSACVFVLAGGDSRVLAGRVGIHRIIRLSSTATTREELNTELQAVYATVRAYLERNGASPLLADVMKTVPNRSLRLLTVDELQGYGLAGNNAAQDDLDRIRLLEKCGDDFMRRRDAWVRAFDQRCRDAHTVLALNACGLLLRRDFGFPDGNCPAESPLAEFNALGEAGGEEAPVQVEEADAGHAETAPTAASVRHPEPGAAAGHPG